MRLDPYSNTQTKTDALGINTLYTYDQNGDLLSFTDMDGNTNTYNYTSDGNLKEVINPDGSKISIDYDSDGRMSRVSVSFNLHSETLSAN